MREHALYALTHLLCLLVWWMPSIGMDGERGGHAVWVPKARETKSRGQNSVSVFCICKEELYLYTNSNILTITYMGSGVYLVVCCVKNTSILRSCWPPTSLAYSQGSFPIEHGNKPDNVCFSSCKQTKIWWCDIYFFNSIQTLAGFVTNFPSQFVDNLFTICAKLFNNLSIIFVHNFAQHIVHNFVQHVVHNFVQHMVHTLFSTQYGGGYER